MIKRWALNDFASEYRSKKIIDCLVTRVCVWRNYCEENSASDSSNNKINSFRCKLTRIFYKNNEDSLCTLPLWDHYHQTVFEVLSYLMPSLGYRTWFCDHLTLRSSVILPQSLLGNWFQHSSAVSVDTVSLQCVNWIWICEYLIRSNQTTELLSVVEQAACGPIDPGILTSWLRSWNQPGNQPGHQPGGAAQDGYWVGQWWKNVFPKINIQKLTARRLREQANWWTSELINY